MHVGPITTSKEIKCLTEKEVQAPTVESMLINISYIRLSPFESQNFLIINDFIYRSRHWLNFNQSANRGDSARSCSVTSYGLSEVVLHSGGAYITSHNKHQGGLHVVLGQWYKNAHNIIKKKSNMSGTIIYGLTMSSCTTLSINKLCTFFTFK